MFGLTYIVDKVFIQASSLAYEVYVEVSPLCSLATMVCCQGHVEQGQSDPEWSGRDLTTKVREQPWPQLMHCALICCHMCGCGFQEDRIVVRRSGEEWYICKGTPNTPLRSLLQSSGATQKPIQYYYVILGLTPIIPRALHCHPAHFPCSDPGYQCRDAKTL